MIALLKIKAYLILDEIGSHQSLKVGLSAKSTNVISIPFRRNISTKLIIWIKSNPLSNKLSSSGISSSIIFFLSGPAGIPLL